MFSLFARAKPVTASINGRPISVQPKETLLQAALRQGVAFPHSCRVGGCASCKCRLLAGQVRELTETGYILTDEELDQGYILACQSVPKGDVCIEVDGVAQGQPLAVSGQVLAQTRLTHDITRVLIQLERNLPYKAGQYAQLSLAGLPGIARSYSFASAARTDGLVSFFVRHVPAGVFSSYVAQADLPGQRVTVAGPLGEFWLRESSAPLLLVAGGSGLAPLLALLQQAQLEGVRRAVTLLFGARRERDLYALDELSAIAAQWPADFRFLPVLSEATAEDAWQGARGLVTEHLHQVLEAGMHAYLCGPPVMIDSVMALLIKQGISRQHIHADRFITAHNTQLVTL
ncbi:2Fe-2S iron-sulfur cluster binding domain-containing protein [Pseudomonas sp. SL4(2022)]|uniref:2Fe-2S iron-sulfur cluster binding domain-containing protein n=1 Tax=Pseudomonas sp. SL4(2022) TaxID=2994661 RepID=UPI002271A522|nr:2Fe-2S iron-sulfur cluster binding domain-containing protein [Pseudomonas sp. SL4(2022)]WAC44056.1 2Fe-2S iron-sulfur cluster binding domain-containing protein [Pseudomonas sp. SL4(2022)]